MQSFKDEKSKKDVMTLALTEGIRKSLKKIGYCITMRERKTDLMQSWKGSSKRQMNDKGAKHDRGQKGD